MPLRVERCSTDIRDFHRPEAISNTPRLTTAFSWPTRPRNRSETPKGKLCERWPLLTARPRRGRDFLVLVFVVQVRNRLGEAGCADLASLSQIASRTAQNTPPSKFFLSPGMGCWPWDQCPTLAPEGWIQPEACCQSSNSDFFMAGFCVNLA